MRTLISLDENLFAAFANESSVDAQNYQFIWAIREGLHRLKMEQGRWREVDSRKEHRCVRGCIIPKDRIYFHYVSVSMAWGDDLKFCVSCLAMILYFKEVGKMPPAFYTDWDIKAKKPIDSRRASGG